MGSPWSTPRRAGFVIDGWLRRCLTAFIFLTFAVQNAWAEVGLHVNPFYGVQYPTLGVPVWLPETLTKLMWASLAATIAMLMWKIANGGPRVPLIVLLPAFTQYIWFVATPAGQFGYMVPFFHSLQYLLIAWNVQLKEGLTERQARSIGALRVLGVVTMDGDQRRRGLRAVLGTAASRQSLRQTVGVQHRRHAGRDPDPPLLRRRCHLATAQSRGTLAPLVVDTRAVSGRAPSVSVPISSLFCFGFYGIFGAPDFYLVSAAFLAGYLGYDMLHYHVHHHRPRTRLGKLLRELHMRHHFQDHDTGYGVSAPFWDHVFGTAPKARPVKPSS